MGCKASKAKKDAIHGQPEPEIKQDAVEEPNDFLANLLQEAKAERAAADALVLARQLEEEQKLALQKEKEQKLALQKEEEQKIARQKEEEQKLARQKEEELARQKEEAIARLKNEELARKKAEELALEKEKQEKLLRSLELATEIATRSFNSGVCAATFAIEEKRVADEVFERQRLQTTLVSVLEKDLESIEWNVDLLKEDAVAGLAHGLIVNHLNIADFITAMDLDRDEMLAFGEFSNGIQALGLPIDTETIEKLFADIDKNGDGKLSYLELSSMRNTHLEQNESSLRKYLSHELSPMKQQQQQQQQPDTTTHTATPQGALVGQENTGMNSTTKPHNSSSATTPKTPRSTTKRTKKSDRKLHESRQAYLQEHRNKKLNAKRGPRDLGKHMAEARALAGEKRVHPFLDPKGTGTPPRARKQFNTTVPTSSAA